MEELARIIEDGETPARLRVSAARGQGLRLFHEYIHEHVAEFARLRFSKLPGFRIGGATLLPWRSWLD